MRRFLVLAILVLLPCLAIAEDEVGVHLLNSAPLVEVHSNFRGETVTLFGTIEPATRRAAGPYSVVVIVEGPSASWVVRQKERRSGLVLNSASTQYLAMPTYLAILSSAPLEQIVPSGAGEMDGLRFEAVAASGRKRGETRRLDAEFVRLMRSAGNFVQGDRDVVLHSPTSFSVRVPVASNAANGLYFARALVFANGKIVGSSSTRFTVRTQGFERFVADLAQIKPVLYGIATVLLALGTGWLGGVLFKR